MMLWVQIGPFKTMMAWLLLLPGMKEEKDKKEEVMDGWDIIFLLKSMALLLFWVGEAENWAS